MGRSEVELDKVFELMFIEFIMLKKEEYKVVYVFKMIYKSNYMKEEYMGLVKKVKIYI